MKSLFVISLLSAFVLNLYLGFVYGFSHSNYTQDWSGCLLNPIGWICANIGLCHRNGAVAFFIQPLFWGGILFFGLQKLREKRSPFGAFWFIPGATALSLILTFVCSWPIGK